MKLLKRNLHAVDRTVRLAVGVVAIYLGFLDPSLIGNDLVATLLGVFGAINVFAFFTGYCPVYGITQFSTYQDGTESAPLDESSP